MCIGNKQVTIFPLQRHVAAEENSFFSRESNNGWRENSMHSLFDAYRAAAASPWRWHFDNWIKNISFFLALHALLYARIMHRDWSIYDFVGTIEFWSKSVDQTSYITILHQEWLHENCQFQCLNTYLNHLTKPCCLKSRYFSKNSSILIYTNNVKVWQSTGWYLLPLGEKCYIFLVKTISFRISYSRDYCNLRVNLHT